MGLASRQRLWIRGGFPRAFLASTDAESNEWRRGFIKTFLERDLPQLKINIRSAALRRFLTMLAHYHAQTWNFSEFAQAFAVADATVRNYLDVLTAALVVFQLQPWQVNISKRQVKSLKVYVADAGILHALLNLPRFKDLEGTRKWELRGRASPSDRSSVGSGQSLKNATSGQPMPGGKLDLLVVSGRLRVGFEIKRTSSSWLTPSIRNAMKGLKLKSLDLVHSGDTTFPLGRRIRAVAFSRLLEDIKPIRK